MTTSQRRNFYQSDIERAAFVQRVADTPEADIAWFTGWMCADGSIKKYVDYTPKLIFQLTDRDPLERFVELFGNSVRGPIDPSRWGLGIKPVYEWSISGEKAYRLLERCRPWMSERYGAKADAIFTNWTPRTHRGRKLNPKQVADIKRDLNGGIRGRALVSQYDVSEAVISAIKVGRVWPQIEASGEAA